jgi:hypothetical protein
MKFDGIRITHWMCHPEPFDFAQDKLREGSLREILRGACPELVEGLRMTFL